MKDFLKISIARLLFWYGYYWHKMFNHTPHYSYLSMRKLFYSTNGQFNRTLSQKIAKRASLYQFENVSKSVLGDLSPSRVREIAKSISENGYFKFDTLLNQEIITELTRFSFQTKAELMPKVPGVDKYGFFDIEKPLTIKYEYHEEHLIQNDHIQRLASDPGLLAISQEFLGSTPILDLIAMWWSTPSKNASSEVAQLYHWDMERIKFLKIFFYLTDVNTDTGPHCYVKGSNNGVPAAVRRDGRIPDEDIYKSFPKENILEITGAKGTIIAVDTSGLHKGKNLVNQNRLLLQFEFANSLFGVPYRNYKVNTPCREFNISQKKYPYVFQRYT